MTFKELLIEIIDERNVVYHGELIPLLFEKDKEVFNSSNIDGLFDTIDEMALNGELKRVQYTLPNSNNERVKSILFHKNAEIF